MILSIFLNLSPWNSADLLKNCQKFTEFKADAFVLIEMIEHLYKKDLDKLEKNIFYIARPPLVIVTTPNYEFNYFFENNET